MLRNNQKRVKRYDKFFTGLLVIGTLCFIGVTEALAGECTDIAGNPNVVFCDDWETGNWSKWGSSVYGTGPASTRKPFMGNYSAEVVYNDLGAPGFTTKTIAGQEELWFRVYVYFDSLYHWGQGASDHCMAPITLTGGNFGVGNAGGLDLGPFGPVAYRSGSYGGERLTDLYPNMGTAADRMFRNGKWTRIEFHLKLNTTGGCSDKNGNGKIDSNGECNGVWEAWVDGKQVTGYYDINYRGNDNPGARLTEFYFNHYYRTGGQSFGGRAMREYRDNLVVIGGSNGGKPIGPAAGEPANLGTPDMLSPYKTEIYKEWFGFDGNGTRIRPAGDCANSLLPEFSWFNNSGSASYVTSPVHNATVSPCQSRLASGGDKAFSVSTSSGKQYSGNGLDKISGLPGKGHVLQGWVFLDPASFPAPNGVALSSFLYWASTGRNYLGWGLDNANHPVLYQQFYTDQNAPVVRLATNTNVTVSTAKWHHFELRGSEDHYYSVLVDSVEVLSARNVNDAALWAATQWSHHFGISDHMNNSKTLRAYYDDISIGTTSFVDCFGWNPAFCPFAGGNTAVREETPQKRAMADTPILSVRSIDWLTKMPVEDLVIYDLGGRRLWTARVGTELGQLSKQWDNGVYVAVFNYNGQGNRARFTLVR